MLTMVWAGTPIFLPLLSFLPSWRLCFLLFACIWLGTLPFAYLCFLESPRFLLSKKCYSQVRDIFEKISVTNRRPPYRFKLAEEMEGENESFLRLKESERESRAVQRERHYRFLDLFRYKSLRRSTLGLMYFWMFRFFIYYGINLALESVLKSGFWLALAIALSSFSEVIGTFGLRTFCLTEPSSGCSRVSPTPRSTPSSAASSGWPASSPCCGCPPWTPSAPTSNRSACPASRWPP